MLLCWKSLLFASCLLPFSWQCVSSLLSATEAEMACSRNPVVEHVLGLFILFGNGSNRGLETVEDAGDFRPPPVRENCSMYKTIQYNLSLRAAWTDGWSAPGRDCVDGIRMLDPRAPVVVQSGRLCGCRRARDLLERTLTARPMPASLSSPLITLTSPWNRLRCGLCPSRPKITCRSRSFGLWIPIVPWPVHRVCTSETSRDSCVLFCCADRVGTEDIEP